jgi:cob(I)alamin adenosyltransferase
MTTPAQPDLADCCATLEEAREVIRRMERELARVRDDLAHVGAVVVDTNDMTWVDEYAKRGA